MNRYKIPGSRVTEPHPHLTDMYDGHSTIGHAFDNATFMPSFRLSLSWGAVGPLEVALEGTTKQ